MRILSVLFLTLLCVMAEERILGFDSEIRVGRDGYLDVVETIRVNVEGDKINRGLYRDFPQEYVTKWGLRQHRPFEVKEVTRNGAAEPYAVESLGGGTRVRIGSADVLLETGSVQEYRITYRTGRQLWFDEEGDELYWNVTGSFWDFPIMGATAKVVLPEGIAVQEAEAYTGPQGRKGRDYEKTDGADGVTFRTTAPLASREGLTVVVRWEPGLLDAAAYKPPGIWEGNGVLFSGLFLIGLGLLIFVLLWLVIGRDPARGVIVPGWEPPAGFSPAAVRYLKNMRFDDRCFTASVLSLASKGFLKIGEFGVGTYKLTKGKGREDMTTDEDGLFQKLFSGGDGLLLTQAEHVRIGGAKAQLVKALNKKVRGIHFINHTAQWLIGLMLCAGGLALVTLAAADPAAAVGMVVFVTVLSAWISGAVAKIREGSGTRLFDRLILIVPVVMACIGLAIIVSAAGVWGAIATLLVMVAAPVFHFLMKAPTRSGRKALDVIAGFREYLSVAEEDRLNLENPPERTPELFERFLPYALALGVEQKWSEKFDDVLSAAGKVQGEQNYRPSFYTGGSSGLERALTGAAIGSAIGGALAASSVAPSSSGSSSGSSGGGGGGGSSGGGGGGGGGGGW